MPLKTTLALAILTATLHVTFGETNADNTPKPNLLKNGGFEETVKLTESQLIKLVTEGWRFPGEPLAPKDWNIKRPNYLRKDKLWIPGTLEVVSDPKEAKAGSNCVKIATPGGRFVRTFISQRVPVPPSKTFKWSYWNKGYFGDNRKASEKIMAKLREVNANKKPENFLAFRYKTHEGSETEYSRGVRPSPLEWRRKNGFVHLKDCVSDTCQVMIVSYSRGSGMVTTNFFDDVRLEAAPKPTESEQSKIPAPTNAPKPRPSKPLVLRDDDRLGLDWRPLSVCGSDFWFASMYVKARRDFHRFPKLADIFNNRTAFVVNPRYNSVEDIDDRNPKAPFFLEAPRWCSGAYCDLAGSLYGDHRDEVISFRPKKTINGVYGYSLDGWKSAAPPPQSILYDFYNPTFIDSVRVHPAFDEGRETRFQVAVSTDDGAHFDVIGEGRGKVGQEGKTFSVGKEITHVKVTVLEDSENQAHILETIFLDKGGATVTPTIVSADSEAAPLNPNHVPTILEVNEKLKEKYGDRFLGFIILEYCNSLGKNMLEFFNGAKRVPGASKGQCDMRVIPNFPFRPKSPKDGAETFANYRQGVEAILKAHGHGGDRAADVLLHDAWCYFEHYTCELGSAMSCTEFATGTWLRARMKLMFSRAAARQYQKPWNVYYTTGFLISGPTKNFEKKRKAGIYKGTPKGQVIASASYLFRSLILAYMMGCNFFEWEEGKFTGKAPTNHKAPRHAGLTEHARKYIQADEFIRDLGDRGVSYTPLAFCVDYMHGMCPNFRGQWGHGDPKAVEEAGRGYQMYWEVLNNLLPFKPDDFRPKAPLYHNVEVDNLRLSNSHCGDVFDVLIPNPPGRTVPQDVFNAYKALILLGKINYTPELIERLKQYVRDGGTLVTSVSQLPDGLGEDFTGFKRATAKATLSRGAYAPDGELIGELPKGKWQQVEPLVPTGKAEPLILDENKNPLFIRNFFGEGEIVTCAVPEMLADSLDKSSSRSNENLIPAAKHILEKIHDEAIPFKINGDIEFLLNRTPDAWLITMINNRGIRKEPFGPMEIEPDNTANVEIIPKNDVNIAKAEELLEGNLPKTTKTGDQITSATVAVPPGDIRVVKLTLNTRDDASSNK